MSAMILAGLKDNYEKGTAKAMSNANEKVLILSEIVALKRLYDLIDSGLPLTDKAVIRQERLLEKLYLSRPRTRAA